MRRSYIDLNKLPDAEIEFECLQCEKHMHQELTDPDSMPAMLMGRCRTCIGEQRVVVRRYVVGNKKITVAYSPAFGGRPDVPGMEVVDCPKCREAVRIWSDP